MKYGIKQVQQGIWPAAEKTSRGYEMWLGYPKQKTPEQAITFTLINDAFIHKQRFFIDHDLIDGVCPCYFVVQEIEQ